MKGSYNLIIGKVLEIIFDLVLCFFSFWLAYIVRIGNFYSTDFPLFPFLYYVFLILPVFMIIFIWSGLYEFKEKTNFEILRIITFSCLVGTMIFVLLFFFKREFFFSRMIVLLSWVFTSLFVFVFHVLKNRYDKKRYAMGKNTLRTLIIGNSILSEKIIDDLKNSKSRFEVVAIINPYGGGKKEISDIVISGKMDALEAVVKEKKIDAIIQTEATEQTLNILNFCENKFLEFLITPKIFGSFSDNIESEYFSNNTFIHFRISPLFGWGQFFKRGMDFLISIFVLIFCSPIFLFYKLKKRKIAFSHSEAIDLYFFDKKSISWIANMINVLFGNVSLVGPEFVSLENRENLSFHQKKVLYVKPGIIKVYKSKDKKDFEEINYISNWTLLRDFTFILKTLFFIK